MRIFKINCIQLLLLFIIGTCNALPTLKISCLENEFQINVFTSEIVSGKIFCLPKTEKIIDCLTYTQEGQCHECPSQSSVQGLDTSFSSTTSMKACIPYSQQTMGCWEYKYTPQFAIKFQCIVCGKIFIDQLQFVAIVDHANGIKKGCAQTIVPGCKEYIYFPADNFIGCKTCNQGFETWEGRTMSDKYCVRPNSVTNCTKLALHNGLYICDWSVCQLTLRFKFGPTLLACVSNEYYSIANKGWCDIYDFYFQNPYKVKCFQCPSKTKLITYYVDSYSNVKTECVYSQTTQYGCKIYAKSPDAKSLPYVCLECISDEYEFIEVDQSKFKAGFLNADQKVGMCIFKGQYDTVSTKCATFSLTMATESSLQCSTCKNATLQPPCLPNTNQKCPSNQGQVEAQTPSGTATYNCLQKGQVIDFCQIYTNDVIIVHCAKCKTGYSLIRAKDDYLIMKTVCLQTQKLIQDCGIYDLQNVNKCITILTAGQNHDQNCIKLNSTDSSKCAQCLTGWILNADRTVCLSNGQNCHEFDQTKSPPVCIKCNGGYVFKETQLNGNTKRICIPYTQTTSHCAIYEFHNSSLQCKECNTNSNYDLIETVQNGISIPQCILNQQSVQHCSNYTQFLNTCTYQCQACKQGFKLVNVHAGFRIYQRCLNVYSQYFEYCGLWIEDNGKLYCKKGYCQDQSVQIPIGLTDKQIACTKLPLLMSFGISLCNYYIRPNIFNEMLECADCVNQWAFEPQCYQND